MTAAINSRVVIPDGRAGQVVVTQAKAGRSDPTWVQVRIDGTAEHDPHPWFLAKDLQSKTAVSQVEEFTS